MSDIELVIKRCKVLEGLLSEKFNAQGRGLHEKVDSIQASLPPALVKRLRYIASIRNKLVHDESYQQLDDPQGFLQACDEAQLELDSLSHHSSQQYPDQQTVQQPGSFFPKPTGQEVLSTQISCPSCRSYKHRIIGLWGVIIRTTIIIGNFFNFGLGAGIGSLIGSLFKSGRGPSGPNGLTVFSMGIITILAFSPILLAFFYSPKMALNCSRCGCIWKQNASPSKKNFLIAIAPCFLISFVISFVLMGVI